MFGEIPDKQTRSDRTFISLLERSPDGNWFMKARDIIKPGENVMVIFTHGYLFQIHDDKTGLTGEWKINPNRHVDRVIIYHRDDEMKNTVYVADRVGVEPAQREGRYNIQLAHVQYVGTTSLNWREFAETTQNSIRYLP